MTHRARRLPALLLALAAGCGGDDGPQGSTPPPRSASNPGPAADTGAGPEASADPTSGDSNLAALRAAVCDTIDSSLDCARAIEAHRLPDAAGVARSGDTLMLRLRTGDTVRLADRSSGEHPVRTYHSYQDHWAEPGLYVIRKQYYEGSEFLLVDDSTGTKTRLPAWPVRAPSGGRFAVFSLDLVAGYGPNTLQIWTIEDGTPTLTWESEPSQWGPVAGSWASGDTLRFTQYGYCDQLGREGRDMCERRAVLHHEGGTWHLAVGDELR